MALWICLSYATGSPRHLQVSNVENVEDSIGSLTRYIVERDFAQGLCVGVIVERGHLLRYILTATPTVTVAVSTVPQMADSEEFENCQEETKVFDNIMVKLLDQGCLSFVIQVNNPKLIVEYFYRSSRRSASRSNKRYLYLPPFGRYDTATYDVSRIFGMKEMAVMPDLVIAKLVKNNEMVNESCTTNNIHRHADGADQTHDIPVICRSGSCPSGQRRQTTDRHEDPENLCPHWKEIEIVTHGFVGSNPGTEVWLDTWLAGKGFLEGADLYPNKMRNLQGKMVQIAAVPNYPPYTIINANSTPPVYDGIELRFVKDFARQFNFTFRVVTDDEGWWGEVRTVRMPDPEATYRVIQNDCRGHTQNTPDATPCDFFLWGYVKVQVYVPPLPASILELKVRIRTAMETITTDMLQTVWNELDYRVDVCRITKSANIEHM